MTHPSARLRELEMRARRRFGQNFLVDADAVDRIVRAATIRPGDRVLEIGPGLGVLSRALLAAGAELTAIELDRDLAAGLREELPQLTLVQGDALRVPLAEAAPGEGWRVVANLPYNVATPLLMRLLGEPARFPTMVLMFQREVGDRIEAGVDDDAFGALSVQVQARARVTRVLELPPGAFHPAPKVWSVVLRFDVHPTPDFGRLPDATPLPAVAFDRAVRAGFGLRRKTLSNALGVIYGRPAALAALEAAGIDPRRRGETIDLAGWRTLAAALASVPVERSPSEDDV